MRLQLGALGCGVGRSSLGLQVDCPQRRVNCSSRVFVLGGQARGAIIASFFSRQRLNQFPGEPEQPLPSLLPQFRAAPESLLDTWKQALRNSNLAAPLERFFSLRRTGKQPFGGQQEGESLEASNRSGGASKALESASHHFVRFASWLGVRRFESPAHLFLAGCSARRQIGGFKKNSSKP